MMIYWSAAGLWTCGKRRGEVMAWTPTPFSSCSCFRKMLRTPARLRARKHLPCLPSAEQPPLGCWNKALRRRRRSGRGVPKPLWALRRYVQECMRSTLLAARTPGALPAPPGVIPPCPTLLLPPQPLPGRDGGQVPKVKEKFWDAERFICSRKWESGITMKNTLK